MSDDAILSLNGLVIGYNEPLCKPITLEVRPGEIIAILGSSGTVSYTHLRAHET